MAYAMHLGAGQAAVRQTSWRAGSRRLGATLWLVQGILAAVYLLSGSMKLALPLEMLTAQMPVPGVFVRFLGLAEFSAAFGLILPGLVRIRPVLTSLAASGLVIIMAGATVITVAIGGGATALMPFVLGVLAAFVAYGRTRLAPQR